MTHSVITPYLKSEITFYYQKRNFIFNTSQMLFSSVKIDDGTKLLLDSITNADYYDPHNQYKILDLGCGYGVIGSVLAKISPKSNVCFSDRDALAVRFAELNAKKNEITNYNVIKSVGYNSITDGEYDFIVSNIPAKAGSCSIKHMILGSYNYLKPSGILCFVIVSPHKELIKRLIGNFTEIEVLYSKTSADYLIYHIKFKQKPENKYLKTGRENYYRETTYYDFSGLAFDISSAYNINEFNSLSYNLDFLINFLLKNKYIKPEQVKHALTYDSGQGHLAVSIYKLYNPATISILSKDKLSLDFTEHNIIQNGCDPNIVNVYNEISLSLISVYDIDLIVWRLDGDLYENIIQCEIDALSRLQKDKKSYIIISGTSNRITFIENLLKKHSNLVKVIRKKKKGNSILLIKSIIK